MGGNSALSGLLSGGKRLMRVGRPLSESLKVVFYAARLLKNATERRLSVVGCCWAACFCN